MKLRAHLFAMLVSGLTLTSCSSTPAEYNDQFLALGTIVSVTLFNVNETLAKNAVKDVKQQMETFTEEWHAWGNGELGRLNRALHQGGCEEVDLEIIDAIKSSQEISIKSASNFDPGVGRLTELWQFNVDERPHEPPPSADDIAVLVAANFSVLDANLKNGSVCASKAGLWLDFGGFAKGVAVDQSIQILQSHGITDAIVNAGGDLRAIGRHGDRPWKIGIRNPEAEGYFGAIEVSGDESVFTSGDYERWFEFEGSRFHHILDPASGYPANEIRSVTVVGSDAAASDAAATALFVSGTEYWPRIAANLGIKDVLVVTKEGEYQSTQSMSRRFKFEDEISHSLVIRSLQ